jgi:hypothetical protein
VTLKNEIKALEEKLGRAVPSSILELEKDSDQLSNDQKTLLAFWIALNPIPEGLNHNTFVSSCGIDKVLQNAQLARNGMSVSSIFNCERHHD